jgi:hypothetical protein
VVFTLMLTGSSVQPGGGALVRADYRTTDHKTTGPPSQRAKGALTLTRESPQAASSGQGKSASEPREVVRPEGHSVGR